MILMPEFGRNVVKLESYLGDAGLTGDFGGPNRRTVFSLRFG
jgi:hypothetical protein